MDGIERSKRIDLILQSGMSRVDKAIELTMFGMVAEDIAHRLKMPLKSLRNLRNKEEYKSKLNKRLRGTNDLSNAILAEGHIAAVKYFVEVVRDEDVHIKYRLQAADKVVNYWHSFADRRLISEEMDAYINESERQNEKGPPGQDSLL